MNKNTLVTALIAAVVFGGGGYWYGTTKAPVTGSQRFTQTGGAGNFGGANARGARGGGGNVFGTILSKDATSITIQLASIGSTTTSSGTKIVLFSGSTNVTKTVDGSSADLIVGENVTVAGTVNSDGSVTAQNIQIRPAGTSPNAR